MFTSRSEPQALFVFVFVKAHLFWKGMLWSPQAMFATFQACRMHFCFNYMPFWKKCVFVENCHSWLIFLSIFINVPTYRTYLPYGTAYWHHIWKQIHVHIYIYIYYPNRFIWWVLADCLRGWVECLRAFGLFGARLLLLTGCGLGEGHCRHSYTKYVGIHAQILQKTR